MWNLGSSFVFGCLFLWFVNFMAGKTEKSGPHLISRPAEPRKITHPPPPSLTTPLPILHSWRSKPANDLHFHLYLLLLKPSFTALRGYLRFQPIRCQFLLSEFGWILWHVFFKHVKLSASEYLWMQEEPQHSTVISLHGSWPMHWFLFPYTGSLECLRCRLSTVPLRKEITTWRLGRIYKRIKDRDWWFSWL